MKLEWDTSTQGGGSKLSADEMVAAFVYRLRSDIYGCESGAVGHVDANVGAGGIARAHVWDFEGARWCDLGVFPSVAEAKATVEALAPLYWRDC